MLTAILFQTINDQCLAPEKLLGSQALSETIRQAVGAFLPETSDTPLWLLDQNSHQIWGTGEFFEVIDSRFLHWVDHSANFWLLCDQDSLNRLLPLLDQLLLIQMPEQGIKSNQDPFTTVEDLHHLGFEIEIDHNRVQNMFAKLWKRIPATEIIGKIMAAGDCDLHLHTNQSDGADSPEQMVDRVLASGLKAFALTDHDNLAALDPARIWLEQRCPDIHTRPLFIPGVELSIEEDRELHLLGYFPRGGMAVIEDFLADQRENRQHRNEKMIRQLQDLGYPIEYEDFAATGEGTIGRLQAAILLRDRGHFPSINAVFEELLGYGRPAYFERPRPTPAEAIWLIRQAGGVAVLAHPGLYDWCSGQPIVSESLLAHLESLQKVGLQGVEAFHGEAPPPYQKEISAAARALGLLQTAGSDDHGINKDHAHLYQKGTNWLAEPEIVVTAALINGQPENGEPTWLLARRSSPGSGFGFWEFPGGKIEPGESPADALARELLEELNVKATIGERRFVLTYAYPERRVILIGLTAQLADENWTLNAHDEIRYVTTQEALELKLLPADVLVFESMI